MRPTISRAWARTDAERGSVSILSLGWIVVSIIALFVMASATQVHVDRMRLAGLADEVAIEAADVLDAQAYYARDIREGEPHVPLDEHQMREAVGQWLAEDPRPWVREVAIVEVSTPDGATAHVTLGRTVNPLFGATGALPFDGGIRLTVDSSARG